MAENNDDPSGIKRLHDQFLASLPPDDRAALAAADNNDPSGIERLHDQFLASLPPEVRDALAASRQAEGVDTGFPRIDTTLLDARITTERLLSGAAQNPDLFSPGKN
jgi:hypothetical protein